MTGKTILKMEHIRKEFPGVLALDDISLELKEGEVHALLGENGAGKSTLIKILAGIYQPDAGSIYIDGQPVQIHTVQDAQRYRISVIHQELCLAENMTVAENIYMGRMDTSRLGLVKDRLMNQKAREIMNRFGLDEISPTQKVGNLTTAQQQMVEIAKALSMDARIIVMDEPTSSLSDKEVSKLFDFIQLLREKNISIIYISHRLEEIFQICDSITVLRDGQYIGSMDVAETTNEHLMSMMVGREFKDVFPERNWDIGKEIFSVEHLCSPGKLKDINFTLHEREVLGFYGLVGSGRTEIMRMIYGVDPIESGSIMLEGKQLKEITPGKMIEEGVILCPESRKDEGLILIQDIDYNMTISILKKLLKGIVLNREENDRIVGEYCRELRVKTPSVHQKVGNLSGGNQQKVVIAKCLATNPKVLILDEPTRGIDVGAKQEIYLLIKEMAASGLGVILISSELPEILNLSNRVVIMHELRQVGILEKDEITQENVIRNAFGG